MRNEKDAIKAAIMSALTGEGGDADGAYDKPTEPTFAQAERLKSVFEAFNEQDVIRPGDMVVIKNEALSMWRMTHPDRVFVCMERLEKPFYGFEGGEDEVSEVSSAYSAIRYDVVLGFMTPDKKLIRHCYDSRHFKIFKK